MHVFKSSTLAAKITRVACAALLAGSLAVFSLPETNAAQAETQADFTNIASIDGSAQTLYTSQNGLPATVATAIAQTTDGFVWIGGYEGLTCFDGQVFEPQNDAPGFSVTALLAGSDKTLWIATSNRGLYRYANGEYAPVKCSSCKKSFGKVFCMAESPDGSIVMGTEHGIARADADGKAVEAPVDGLPDVLVRSIASSNKGTVLAITQDSRLFSIENNKATEISLPNATGNPRCASFDSATQKFYVGTDENTVCVLSADGAVQSTFEIEGANRINSVNMTKKGVAWICSDNGVYSYFDGKTLKQNLQMDNSVDSMLIDSEGNHWFASSRQGVLLVGNTPFKDISSFANMPYNVVNALVKYDGKLLVGTDDGATVIDPATNLTTPDSRFRKLDSQRIRDFKVDRDGRLWVATANGGVLRMDKTGKWTAYTKNTSKAITTNTFRCLYETDSAMIAGSEEGAIVIDGKGVRNAVKKPGTLKERIMSIAKMDDILLFGTDSYGLQLVKDEEVVGSFTTENGLPSDSVMKTYPCSNNKDTILVTGCGLAKLTRTQKQPSDHFDEGSFAVSPIENLPASNTLDLVRQNDGTVWVATGKGICRTTESSLLNGKAAECKLYTRQDGLPYDITANSTQFADGDILYLAGTGGVIALDTKTAAAMTDSCTPSVTGAYADGQPIPVDADNTITIPANTERIRIMAHATTFDKTNIMLFYKLDGYDSRETTEPFSSFNGLEYTNLGGGTYQLHFGAWDEAAQKPLDSVTVTIKKEYGLLDHPITRVAEIVLALGLIALGFAWRRRRLSAQLQKEYEEKERCALKKMAYSDLLTEAYNRNYLNEWELSAHEQDHRFPISLITIDLNDLKQINDTMGHSAGDDYLRCTIQSIFDAFGKKDTTVVRLGGDEFLIIAEGIEQDIAVQRIERTCEILGEHTVGSARYSLCYGVETIDGPEFSLDEKMRLADERMMEEKRRYHETHDRRRPQAAQRKARRLRS